MYKDIEIIRENGRASGYKASAQEEQLEFLIRFDWSSYIRDVDAVITAIRSRVDSFAVVKNISVDEGYRGNGLGSEILGEFLDEVDDVDLVLLEVDIAETQCEGFDLRQWYENNDFIIISDLTGVPPIMAFPEERANELLSII